MLLATSLAASPQAVLSTSPSPPRWIARHHLARDTGIPVVFTRVSYRPDGLDGGLFYKKVPALSAFVEGSQLAGFADDLRPLAADLVVTKQYASAFSGTSLAAALMSMGIDTIVVTGVSTSGCVRATATDGIQLGFRPLVVRDATGDRSESIHEANLFDLGAKYADVVASDEVRRYFAAV